MTWFLACLLSLFGMDTPACQHLEEGPIATECLPAPHDAAEPSGADKVRRGFQISNGF